MKNFLIKTVIFVAMLFTLLNIVQYLIPYYWGNPGYSAKIRYLSQSSETYNTYFFGSSRIYRHIDPALFDELTDQSTASYNMGYPGTSVPEAYYLLENFIASSEPVEDVYIITEIQTLDPLANKNMHTTRVRYYMFPDEYLFAIRAILENDVITNEAKYKRIRNYTITLFERFLGIGLLAYLIDSGFTSSTELDPTHNEFGLQTYGYYALERELSETSREDLIFRNQYLLENPDIPPARKVDALNTFADKELPKYSAAHLERIESLIALGEEKGYHLIFLNSPNLPAEKFPEILPVFNQIEDQHKIDLADPNLYPEFYDMAYQFDVAHLNNAGLKIYTRQLATAFDALVSEEP